MDTGTISPRHMHAQPQQKAAKTHRALASGVEMCQDRRGNERKTNARTGKEGKGREGKERTRKERNGKEKGRQGLGLQDTKMMMVISQMAREPNYLCATGWQTSGR
mmetsp:Transcript_18230/g.38970  ORF Transcript_18230/g.38970 Transcript_18230/m.38970 type:complete len:106 (+) Transcript_18230:193-510(+)